MCLFSLEIHESQDNLGKEKPIPTLLYQFHPLHKHLDFSQVIN